MRYLNVFLLFCVVATLCSCGPIQSSNLEKMEENERWWLLSTKTTEQLCHAYNNVFIKPETEKQVAEILRSRDIKKCDALYKVRVVPPRALTAEEKAAVKKAAAEKAAADKVAAERAAAERAAEERAAEERAAKEKAAAAERAILEDAISQKAIAKGYINIIGLVPGVSTQEQAERAKDGYGYVIGGYKLICSPECINKKLSSLVCVTGEDSGSIDLVSGQNIAVSNIEIHNTLVKGFTKKIGRPKLSEIPTRTRIGVEYTAQMAIWKDKKGNELTLLSMTTDIDTGALILKSAEQIKFDKEAEEKAYKARNF